MAEDARIGTLLNELSQALADVSESPRLDAEILVGRAIDMPRSYLFAHPEDSLDETAIRRLNRALKRRLGGEPMAYITGKREFWSMELAVSPATLVPRPETEILVDQVLARIPRKASLSVLDLGTGSGAIALAIARERPLCEVTGVDICSSALGVAQLNARELAIPNVIFVESDWIDAVRDRQFDIVVSNPPYVRDDDALQDLASEPHHALAAGPDGLDALRVLVRDCSTVLVPGGLLALEHGADQEIPVASLLAEHGWLEIQNHRDYAGLPRVTTARAAPAAEL